MCKRAESEALACPQGKQVSGGPGFRKGTRGQTVFLWPQACIRAGQLVVTDLAGQNKLSELQEAARWQNSMFWLGRHSR